VGLTRQSIIAIEKGRFTPSIHSVLLLARALEASVDELFWLEEGDSGGKRA
jgi:putative transcriptional regulator